MDKLRSVLTRLVKSPKTTSGVILGVATIFTGHTYKDEDIELLGLAITSLSGLLGRD